MSYRPPASVHTLFRWAVDLVADLNRHEDQIGDKRSDAVASQDGVLVWDRSDAVPQVSRSGEFVGLAMKVDAPSSASDTGTAGDWASDTDYFYVCTATDTWKRVAIATW